MPTLQSTRTQKEFKAPLDMETGLGETFGEMMCRNLHLFKEPKCR